MGRIWIDKLQIVSYCAELLCYLQDGSRLVIGSIADQNHMMNVDRSLLNINLIHVQCFGFMMQETQYIMPLGLHNESRECNTREGGGGCLEEGRRRSALRLSSFLPFINPKSFLMWISVIQNPP